MGESPASEAAPTASTRSPARRGCGVRDSGFRIRLLKWLKLIGVIKQRLFYASTGAVNLRRVNLRSSVNRLTTRESSSHQTPPSTIQSVSFRTYRRIARNPCVCARFAIMHGPGERPRQPNP